MTRKMKALIAVGVIVFGVYKGFSSLNTFAHETVAKSDCVELAKKKLGIEAQAVDVWYKHDGRDTVVKLATGYETRLCVVDRQSATIVGKLAENEWR